jgi:hypothetical protein
MPFTIDRAGDAAAALITLQIRYFPAFCAADAAAYATRRFRRRQRQAPLLPLPRYALMPLPARHTFADATPLPLPRYYFRAADSAEFSLQVDCWMMATPCLARHCLPRAASFRHYAKRVRDARASAVMARRSRREADARCSASGWLDSAIMRCYCRMLLMLMP